MKLIQKFHIICLCLVFLALLLKSIECILFQRYTLMQVVFAVSWPIPYKNPQRKLFFNIGFQFNYAEPFLPSNFYNPPYIQNAFTNREMNTDELSESTTIDNETDIKSNVNFFSQGTESINNTENNTTEVPKHDEAIPADTSSDRESKSKEFKRARNIGDEKHFLNDQSNERNELIGSDITAAQLYEGIEDNLLAAGYHQSCLLKSICELAKHPLHQDDEEHLLVEVLHFLLTPTVHQGFASNEEYQREKYEVAQQIGENGFDCDSIYSECENSFLTQISFLSNRIQSM